jgi:hypothetical protein
MAVDGDQALSGLDAGLVGDTAFEDIEEDPHGLRVIGFEKRSIQSIGSRNALATPMEERYVAGAEFSQRLPDASSKSWDVLLACIHPRASGQDSFQAGRSAKGLKKRVSIYCSILSRI